MKKKQISEVMSHLSKVGHKKIGKARRVARAEKAVRARKYRPVKSEF